MRERGRGVQPGCTAQHDRRQQVERLPGSEPRVRQMFGQMVGQVDRTGIRVIAAQQLECVAQPFVIGNKLAIHR
ncbi:MAG: hypothetical protein M5U30_20565 [Burkholderiaceae bacterium]|nr:hypothetical protein [Burkholderiaceae bacterium]